MKTTVELAPDLVDQAKRYAAERGITFKVVLESALWQFLKSPPKKRRRKMRDLSVGGEGLQPGIDPTNWDQIRALIYEGHGG